MRIGIPPHPLEKTESRSVRGTPETARRYGMPPACPVQGGPSAAVVQPLLTTGPDNISNIQIRLRIVPYRKRHTRPWAAYQCCYRATQVCQLEASRRDDCQHPPKAAYQVLRLVRATRARSCHHVASDRSVIGDGTIHCTGPHGLRACTFRRARYRGEASLHAAS